MLSGGTSQGKGLQGHQQPTWDDKDMKEDELFAISSPSNGRLIYKP